jgi:hypothetical protein
VVCARSWAGAALRQPPLTAVLLPAALHSVWARLDSAGGRPTFWPGTTLLSLHTLFTAFLAAHLRGASRQVSARRRAADVCPAGGFQRFCSGPGYAGPADGWQEARLQLFAQPANPQRPAP